VYILCKQLFRRNVSSPSSGYIKNPRAIARLALGLQPPAHAGSSLADFLYTVNMEAMPFETSIYTISTRRHIPEDGILQIYVVKTSNLTKYLVHNELVWTLRVLALYSQNSINCLALFWVRGKILLSNISHEQVPRGRQIMMLWRRNISSDLTETLRGSGRWFLFSYQMRWNSSVYTEERMCFRLAALLEM
jgi:hypothetical protein